MKDLIKNAPNHNALLWLNSNSQSVFAVTFNGLYPRLYTYKRSLFISTTLSLFYKSLSDNPDSISVIVYTQNVWNSS